MRDKKHNVQSPGLLVLAMIIGCGGAAQEQPAPSEPGSEARVSSTRQAPKNEPPPAALEAHFTSSISRKDLLLVLAKGGQWVISQFEVEPSFKKGRFVGWKIVDIRPKDAVVSRWPILRGDVVSKVNGMPIERPEQFIKAFDKLRTAPRLQVDLQRGGSALVLSYEIVNE